MRYRLIQIGIAGSLLIILTACSGGGDDSSASKDDGTTPIAGASSEWDTMKWDEGEWK